MAQPASQPPPGATGPTSPTTGPYGLPAARPPGSTPIGIGGSGANIPAVRIDPRDARRLHLDRQAGAFIDTPDPHAVPADLNGSWRSLMWSLGVHLPNGLNRAVAVSRRLHRAVA